MWKVIRRGLMANKVRFALTGIAVILGVAFISGTLVLTSTISKSFDDLFATIDQGTDAIVRAHVVISGGFGSGDQRPNIPASTLDLVRRVPSVAAAEGNVDFNKSYAQIVDRHGKAIGGGGPPTAGIGWVSNPQLNQFRLIAGGPPETADQVVLDKHTADKGKFKVGDTVTVLTTGPPSQYKVVGIAKFGTQDSLLGASITLFQMEQAQKINHSVGKFGQIAVVAKDGVSQTQVQHDIQQALVESGKGGGIEVLTGKQIIKESQDNVQKALKFFNVALLAFGVIALVVGAFIIYNTFSIVLAQRVREMALLRSLGASQGQVRGQIAGEAFVLGIVASALGIAAGIGLAILLRAVMNAVGFGLPSTTMVIPASAIIAGFAVGIGITLLSAIAPAWQASRIPPIAALRDYTIEKPPRRVPRFITGGALFVFGFVLIFNGLFGSPDNTIYWILGGTFLVFAGAFVLGPLFSRMAARIIGAPISKVRGIRGTLARENAARSPKRTTTTAIPLVIGVALVGFITIFAASAKATVVHAVDTQFKTDFLVTNGSGFNQSAGFSPDLAKSIGQLDVVKYHTGVAFNFAGINGKHVQLNASDPQASEHLVDFTNVAGTFSDLKDNGIAISKRKADEQHWKLGSVLVATFSKQGVGTVPLTVQYIYKENTFGDFFITSSLYNKSFDNPLDQIILIKLKEGVSAKEGRAALEPLLKPYPTANLRDNAQYKDDQTASFNGLITFIYALLFFSLFIALIGIANTLILSIHERRHEIGLLRAVGMSRSQVRSSIRWESVIVCLIGTLNGLVIGLMFGWIMVRALRDEGFSQFAIAPGQLLVIVIIVALLSVVAAIFPARRASKLDILKAIATE